jgi:hypothetical protein
MCHHPKKILEQSKNNVFGIASEILTAKNALATPLERHNVFEYVQEMAKELSKLSTEANNGFLSYLLTLVGEEAQQAKRKAGQEASAS